MLWTQCFGHWMQSWSTFNPRGIQLPCSKAALQCKPWCCRRFAELPLCSVLKHWCSQILSLFRLHTRNDMIEIFLWLYGFSLCSSPRELQGILSYLTLLGPHNCCAVCSNRQRMLYILNLVCPGNISSAFCCKRFQCFLLQIKDFLDMNSANHYQNASESWRC